MLAAIQRRDDSRRMLRVPYTLQLRNSTGPAPA
jgi:hypothetical protein